jgi:hypothetical protein
MPTIWVILIAIVVVVCIGCCDGLKRFGIVFH